VAETEPLGQQIMLSADHVANYVLRELRPESIFRLAGVSAANGIDRNYEVLVGIVGFSGADQRCIAGSNAACAMGYENGVTLCIVELPVCGVADLHACELFTILEGELGDGMNRILRRHTEWMPTKCGCDESCPKTHTSLPHLS
jgi:hypothetical protein